MYSIVALSKDESKLDNFFISTINKVYQDGDRVVIFDKGSTKHNFWGSNLVFPRNALMLMEAVAGTSEHTVLFINRLDLCRLSVLQFLVKLFENDRNVEVYVTALDTVESGRDIILSTLSFNEVKRGDLC